MLGLLPPAALPTAPPDPSLQYLTRAVLPSTGVRDDCGHLLPAALPACSHTQTSQNNAVQVCVTIVGTYFLLNAENYHWHWTAFSAGASTCECTPCFGLIW